MFGIEVGIMLGQVTNRRQQTNRTTRGRSGFSLLEILLVMSVFIVITALAMPVIQRTYSGQQLRSAADVVRSRFGQARVKAIETGDVYGFFYSEGAGNYFVAPMTEGFQSILAGQLSPDQEQLDNDVRFVAGETVQDGRSEMTTENSPTEEQGMRPILFYPDGTSQDATVILQNRNGALIQINLRGLTGVSKPSVIMTPEEIGQ